MTNPPEYPHDPSQQPYGQQPQQPQQPQQGGYPGTPSGGQYYQQPEYQQPEYQQHEYQQPGVPPQPPAGGFAQPGVAPGPGFFGALFDFSFRQFVTSRIIKVLYILWLVLIGISVLSGVVSAFGAMAFSVLTGIFLLLGSLVGGAIGVLLSRVVLELLIVVFRISEDLTAIRQRGGM